MSRQTDRERFFYQMAGLDVPINVARKVLRHAATIQRCNEASCSYEWADRDRVECPGMSGKVPSDCICDFGYEREGYHGTVPCVDRTAKRREAAIVALLAPFSLVPVFQGDPRGWCVRILRPNRCDTCSYLGPCTTCPKCVRPTMGGDRRGGQYSDGIGVPA